MDLPAVRTEVRPVSVMFARWRHPLLDRIGSEMAVYETCRCVQCKRRVMKALHAYDRTKP